MSDTLLNEIRASRPSAPAALRERVRALAVDEPARETFLDRLRFTWGWRRLVLVAPAAILVALLAGSVIGLTRDRETAVSGDAISDSGGSEAATRASGPTTLEAMPKQADSAAAPPTTGLVGPTPGTLQRFEAELSLKVEDVNALSDATKRAQRIALDHGGSVASLAYDAPSQGVGGAQITLRVPTHRVQSALAQLSQLGTILGQRYGITDLQQQSDSLQRQIEDTQRQIARIRAQLGNPNLTDENEAVLRSRLANAQQKLAGLREALRTTRAEGATSTVYLTLTTEEIQATPVGGGRLEGIKDVLVWEAVAALYLLVVAGPIVLLAVLVWLTVRWTRRRETSRLLEQN
jgi:Domain of unknown function (DUF4349)